MPIYEYEPDDRECEMCDGKIAVIQGIEDPPLKYCPHCGLEVHRVISRASFKVKTDVGADRAAAKGFTTYKRAEQGTWEKVGGEGADYLVGSKEDMEAINQEKLAPKKVLDLDKE